MDYRRCPECADSLAARSANPSIRRERHYDELEPCECGGGGADDDIETVPVGERSSVHSSNSSLALCSPLVCHPETCVSHFAKLAHRRDGAVVSFWRKSSEYWWNFLCDN